MKKHCCLPPGALDELIARIEAAEERLAELEEVAPRLTALDAGRACVRCGVRDPADT